MDDFGNIDISFLTDYFEDITKSAEEAKDTVDNFHVSIDDVSEATKSANKDADWSTMQSAYKAAGELLKEGKTGTDDFQTVAQFFTDEPAKTRKRRRRTQVVTQLTFIKKRLRTHHRNKLIGGTALTKLSRWRTLSMI